MAPVSECKFQEADDQCLRDLRITDPRDDKARIQDTNGGLLRDCCSWIIDHADYKDWLDDPQRRLLWIKGGPRKGKTMLLCGIIDEVERSSDETIASFFCQATEPQLNNATAVLRGLIYCLARHDESLLEYIRNEYDCAGKAIFEDRNAWTTLSRIFVAMIRDPGLHSATIFVDALDECTTGRQQLLHFILRCASAFSCAKWVVSSRNLPEIEEQLFAVEAKVTISLEANQASVEDAISRYTMRKVLELVQSKNLNQQDGNQLMTHMLASAEGTFLWASLKCQELADPTVRQRHFSTLLRSAPPGLYELYHAMMGHVCRSRDAAWSKAILAIVAKACQSVTVEDMRLLAGLGGQVRSDEMADLVRSCGSMLTIEGDFIQLVHPSAKQYLLENAAHYGLPLMPRRCSLHEPYEC